MAEPTVPAQYALLLERLLQNCIRSVDDLTAEQLNRLPTERANSIGFDIWHVARTIDNIIFFVFEREQPVWLSGGFEERLGLPRVAQGTGMTDAEAHALRITDPAPFVEYLRALTAAVVPRVAGMSMEYLAQSTTVRPWGEVPRMEQIGQVLIAHGNGHLGQRLAGAGADRQGRLGHLTSRRGLRHLPRMRPALMQRR